MGTFLRIASLANTAKEILLGTILIGVWYVSPSAELLVDADGPQPTEVVRMLHHASTGGQLAATSSPRGGEGRGRSNQKKVCIRMYRTKCVQLTFTVHIHMYLRVTTNYRCKF